MRQKVDRRLSLSLWEQRRRPPPAAETGRSCWGRGQRDASGSEADAGSRNPGSATEGGEEGKPAYQELSTQRWALAFVRAMPSLFFCFSVASLPSQALRASSPRGGASGVSARPMLDEQSFFILKTAVPCYRGQQLRNNILVKLLLISVAGHYILRHIGLPAVSGKWPGLPKPLLQGEVARRRRDGEVVQRRACPL